MKRLLLALLTLVALTVGLQANPATAAQGPVPGLPQGEVVCFVEFRHGVPVGIRCIAFGPIRPDCPRCDALAVDFGTDIRVLDPLVNGFGFLDQAARAVDPAVAKRARAAALAQFMTVARALPVDNRVVRDTGYVERNSGQFVSSPQPRLIAAGGHLEAGLRWLRLAGINPDVDPIHPIEQGMRELGQAYQSLQKGES